MKTFRRMQEAQAKGRAGSKAASDRTRSIESKLQRHARLDSITRFVYSPSGDNRSRDSLSHAEVIAMTVDFPPLPVKMTPLHPDHFLHQGA